MSRHGGGSTARSIPERRHGGGSTARPCRCSRAALSILIILNASILGADSRGDAKAFQSAVSLFSSAQYRPALEAFQDFATGYPGSPLRARLSYWIGACALKLKDYEIALGYLRVAGDSSGADQFMAAHSLLLAGAALEELGRSGEAEAAYREILARRAPFAIAAEAAFRLAGVSFRGGSFTAARDLYGKLLIDFPSSGFSSESQFFLAESELALGRLPEAERRFRTLLSLYPDSPRIAFSRYRIAEILWRQGRKAEAVSALEDLLKEAANGELIGSALCLLGDILLEGKDFGGALAVYTRALEELPEGTGRQETCMDAGIALSMMGKLEEAVDFLEKASLGPSLKVTEQSRFRLARALFELGRRGEAELGLESFVSDFKDSPFAEQALELLGEMSWQRDDFPRSFAWWDRLVREFPASRKTPERIYRRGLASLRMGDEPAALDDFQRIRSDFPRSEFAGQSAYDIGAVYSARSEFSRAISFFQAALDSSASRDLALRSRLAMGVCRFNLGAYALALSGFDSLLPDLPKGAERQGVILYAGRALYRLERYPQAAICFQEAAGEPSEEGGSAQALYWLAWSQFRMGKPADARRSFLLVGDRHPEDPSAAESLLRASFCSAQLADDAGAVEILDRALALASGPAAREMREKALFEKGWALARLGKSQQSDAVFEDLASEFPDGKLAAEAFFKKAEQAVEQGRLSEGVEGFKRISRDFPSHPLAEQALYRAADAELEAGNASASALLFWSCLVRYTRGAFFYPALEGMERALTAAGTPDAARGLLEAARDDSGLRPELRSAIELDYARLLITRSPEEAIELIKEASGRQLPEPLAGEAVLLMARCYTLQGELDKAREILQGLREARTDRIGAQARLELARALESAGDSEAAVEMFAGTAAIFRSFPDLAAEGLANAARVARLNGDFGKARIAEARLKKDYPQSPWALMLAVERDMR